MLTSEAANDIFNECKELGIDVGTNPKAFVDEQIRLSRTVVLDLPGLAFGLLGSLTNDRVPSASPIRITVRHPAPY
jgi:hypothetical protein